MKSADRGITGKFYHCLTGGILCGMIFMGQVKNGYTGLGRCIMGNERTVVFVLEDMTFEYDEEKNRINIQKHGISFRSAARVFFDYDRIELYDEENSVAEDRFNTIGDTSAGNPVGGSTTIGNVSRFERTVNDILFVVYMERERKEQNGTVTEVTRLISARMATNFERGLYYGKYD